MLQSFKQIKNICLFFISVSFNSCALMFNCTTTNTNIHTYPEHAQIIINKKDTFCCNVELIPVKRSRFQLEIKAKKDSLEKTVLINPKLSSAYIANLFNLYGFLIDLASSKRYTYPNDIYINLQEKNNEYNTISKLDADNQLINLVLHVPLLNAYNFSIANQILYNQIQPSSSFIKNDTIGGQKSSTGTLGLSGSLEIHFNKNYYLSGNFGYFHNSPFFLYSFPNRDFRYISLSMNRRFDRFHIGAGLGWVKYNYSNDPSSDNSDPIGYVDTHGFALRIEAQYQLSNRWYLSTNYQPIIGRDKGGDNNTFSFWGLEMNYKIPVATKTGALTNY